MSINNEDIYDLLNTINKRLDELEDAVGSGNRILLRRLDELDETLGNVAVVFSAENRILMERLDELEDTVGSRLDRLEDSIRDEINKEK